MFAGIVPSLFIATEKVKLYEVKTSVLWGCDSELLLKCLLHGGAKPMLLEQLLIININK